MEGDLPLDSFTRSGEGPLKLWRMMMIFGESDEVKDVTRKDARIKGWFT